MAHRIEVGFKPGIRDALGEKTARKIVEQLGLTVDRVITIDVYTIDGNLTDGQLETIAKGPLSDPVIQQYVIDRGLAVDFTWMIEVG
ncbi:MAG: phosphoribosylformylglycinamidine synthase subunit PurS, partial [Deltaproteobacteria bacterium]|nr:phosphoribosylformylglycinamidine synthase subunit PurS [Deltaproteobacteria bacterium]